MPVYLNTYETYEAYGGPEEGGWWYTCGEPVQSVFISDDELEDWIEANSPACYDMRDAATLRYTAGKSPTPIRNGAGGYSFVLGSDEPSTYRADNSFTSCFEDGFAEPYPATRPRYE